MLAGLAKNWWLILLKGICAVIFGVLAFAWPGATILSLVLIFAIYCFSDGIAAISIAMLRGSDGKSWGQMLFVGILSILSGIIAAAWPGASALALLFIVAIWSILHGILEIVAAIELRKVIDNEWLLILAGVSSILFGGILLAQPEAGAIAVVWIIGAYAILYGVLLMSISFRLKGIKDRLTPPASPQPM